MLPPMSAIVGSSSSSTVVHTTSSLAAAAPPPNSTHSSCCRRPPAAPIAAHMRPVALQQPTGTTTSRISCCCRSSSPRQSLGPVPVSVGCGAAPSFSKSALQQQQHVAGPLGLYPGGSSRPAMRSRSLVVAAAQRRRLFGGGAPDGSSSSSSSDEDDVVASAAGGGTQPPRQQQQQRRALAAAQMAATTAAADRARRRQEALLRLERSKALMRKVQDSTSGGLISTELRQMLSKDIAADAADILAASPSTLRQELAAQGADLEADWAEAELASTAAQTTTGRAKSLAARAAAAGLSAAGMLRPERPRMKPRGGPSFQPDYDDDYDDFDDDDDDDDAWSEILDYDDPSFWKDERLFVGTSSSAAAIDPADAGAAAIRKQMNDPAFQAWLQQQDQERAAKEARAAAEARLRQAVSGVSPAADRLLQRQQAAELARLQSKLLSQQQQQQQQLGLNRPLAKPKGPGGLQAAGPDADLWDDDEDEASAAALTPSQMLAMLQQEDQGFDAARGGVSSSGSRQMPVFTPKPGYSYSSQAQAAAGKLAAAGASGQLQKPLLVRPAVRPTGSAGSNTLLDQQSQFWDDAEAAAAAAAEQEAQRKNLIQSLLAQEQQQQQRQQQQQQQQRRQPSVQDAGVTVTPDGKAAAERLQAALYNAQLARPSRPGAPAAANFRQPGSRQPSAPSTQAAAAGSAGVSLQRPAPPGQQQREEEEVEGVEVSEDSDAVWDEEERAAAAAQQREAARLALMAQLAAEVEAAEAAAPPTATQTRKPSSSQSRRSKGSSSSSSAPAALQGLKRPSPRPGQQQQQHAEPQGSSKSKAAKPQVPRALQPPAAAGATAAKKLPGLVKPARPQVAAQTAAPPQQQVDSEDVSWEEVEAAEQAAAQAEAEWREMLLQLAEAGAAAEEEENVANIGSSSSSAGSKREALANDLDQMLKKLDALPDIQQPLSRPKRPNEQQPSPAAAAAPPAAAGSSKKQPPPQQQPAQETQQPPQQQPKGRLKPKKKQEQQDKAGVQQQQQQPDRPSAASAAAATDKAAAAERAAALHQRLQQAADALPSGPQPNLQRPAVPTPAAKPNALAKAATAAAPAASPARQQSRPQQQQQPLQRPVKVTGPGAADAAAEAVDWRWAAAAAAGDVGGAAARRSSSSSSGRVVPDSRQSVGRGGGSGNGNGSAPVRGRFPRTVPEDKLELAQHLELTRTPTTAVVLGVASNQARAPNLIVHLEQLGCVSLLPVAHLLPSQLFQLDGLDPLDQAAALKACASSDFVYLLRLWTSEAWKGRRLDVIVATMPEPRYLAEAAASILLQSFDAGVKYVRCVAVACCPPAWLQEQSASSRSHRDSGTSTTTTTSSSSSSRDKITWVAGADQLLDVPSFSDSGGLAPYSTAQLQLWAWCTAFQGPDTSTLGAIAGVMPTMAQVVGVHPRGYLLCQVKVDHAIPKLSSIVSRRLSAAGIATVAVPLELCPSTMRLGPLALSAADKPLDAAADSAQPGGLQLFDGEQQPRWKPWQLARADEAAQAAAGRPQQQQQQQQLAGRLLGAAELQSWRQGVLGMWKQPFLNVCLLPLPLEQQQDPGTLAAALQQHKKKQTAGSGDGGAQQQQHDYVDVAGAFATAENLLLLARVVAPEEEGYTGLLATEVMLMGQ